MVIGDIKNKKFDRATVGGYKMEDVNAFQLSVSTALEDLLKEKTELESKFVILADKLEEYRKDEESMRSALLGAQKLGDSIVKESTEKGQEIINRATLEASSVVEAAKAEAERINGEAKITLESQTYAINKMKREVSRFKAQITALYKQHITLIEGLPDEDVKMADLSTTEADTAGAPPVAPPLTTSFANKAKEKKEEKKISDSSEKNLKDDFKIKE